jgi:4-hydroxy-3-methylbut-2-en-1-yl diphosphate synthase IspG/GcpE
VFGRRQQRSASEFATDESVQLAETNRHYVTPIHVTTRAEIDVVKIAIMRCIVNGPGEMADADFGYVSVAPGKVNLYIGKTAVKFNIPEAEAVDRLKDLIRERGKWVEAVPQKAAAEPVSAS